jgi:hypothetical protein
MSDKIRVGIVLTGVSHDLSGSILSGWGQSIKRTFRTYHHNFFEYIYNPIKETCDVSVYLTTYNNGVEDELLRVYKPDNYVFLNPENSRMRKTYLISIFSVMQFAKDVDIFVFTRFDVEFHKKFTELNVDLDKINFLFKEIWSAPEITETSDVLFVVPRSLLIDFLVGVQKCDEEPRRLSCSGDLHDLYDKLSKMIGEDKLHIISKVQQHSGFRNVYFDLAKNQQPREIINNDV